jgi:hypothetical protein
MVLLGQQDLLEIMELRLFLEEAGFRKLAEKWTGDPSSVSGAIEPLEIAYKNIVDAKA